MRISLPKPLLVSCLLFAAGILPTHAATFTDPGGSGGTIPDNGAVVNRPLVASGLAGTVTSVTVTLTGFSHTFGQDLDFLLVAPDGTHNLEFMSDAGGFNPGFSNITITLADSGATVVPQNTAPVNGTTYRPADYGTQENDAYFGTATGGINHPTGNGGSATFATAFNTLVAPNGTWRLYVKDGALGDTGSFTAWTLTILTSGGNQPPVINNLNLDRGDKSNYV
jgi:hypothetical protein